MPQVTINAYASLRKFTDGVSRLTVDVSAGQTVGDVLQQLGIPLDQAHVVFINNRSSTLAQALQGGEQVDLFSAIGGG